ncbi:hypothetical protein NUW58_g9652 [Xylaria curta]|uniref:Uncharacterized protein n=1 Tax=Xylaria curta TaxID=42375 RepID=A0ACC1MV05_9PEZI|nr:hypothetical protein NUW58_g9652 [Xylaria curta]
MHCFIPLSYLSATRGNRARENLPTLGSKFLRSLKKEKNGPGQAKAELPNPTTHVREAVHVGLKQSSLGTSKLLILTLRRIIFYRLYLDWLSYHRLSLFLGGEENQSFQLFFLGSLESRLRIAFVPQSAVPTAQHVEPATPSNRSWYENKHPIASVPSQYPEPTNSSVKISRLTQQFGHLGKRIALPTRVEPKVFFANERTFLSWLNFTVILGALAIGMLNFGDRPAFISAFLFTGVAMLTMIYALFTYHWRAKSIRVKGQAGFDDRFGPTVLAIILLLAVIVNFVLRITYVGAEGGKKH